ncbi:MAG TPA: M23 family metallopeptidase [Anaerovoracaceae bacterium]|nr:M23 family metallopeptidase [Anaerovoracaceae bacterium]
MRLNNKKPNDRVAVALVLCFCVVAIASIFTMRSNFSQLDLDNEDDINIAQEDNQQGTGEQKVIEPVPTVDSTAQKPDTAENQPAKPEKSRTPAFTVPVKGQVSKEFSVEIPIYSLTLDQYIVHSGIDIQAPPDTQVVAAAAGTITKVYNDDKLGITIEISHGNGIVTKYSNLSTTKMVEEGDVVEMGQPISGIGSSALFESLESPHLHFEVLKDGVAIDPMEYVK